MASVNTLQQLPKALEEGLRSGTEQGVKAAAPEMLREFAEVLPGVKRWLEVGTEYAEYKLKEQIYRYEPQIFAGDRDIQEGILAIRLLRELDLQKALASVRKLKKAYPNAVDVLLEEAIVLQDLNQIEEAREVVNRISEVFKGSADSPENAEILLRTGLVESSAGNYKDAYDKLVAASKIRPQDPRILDSIGMHHTMERKFG